MFTADGRPMPMRGTIQLTINIQEFQIPVSFCVFSQLQFDVILGMQFLKETKANIDLESQVLTLYGDLVGANLLDNNQTLVRTTDAFLIPPKSECLVPVIVPPEFGPGLAIIEPSVKLHKLQLALARTIVSPLNNRTVCKIMNPTNVARFLRRRTPLGIIQNLSIDSVTVINDSDLNLKNLSEVEIKETPTHAEKCRTLTEKGINLQQNSLTTDEFCNLWT